MSNHTTDTKQRIKQEKDINKNDMKRYLKFIVAGIIALLFIGMFVFLYQKSQPQPVIYEEFVPKIGDISKTTVITGKIEPRNELSPTFTKRPANMCSKARSLQR